MDENVYMHSINNSPVNYFSTKEAKRVLIRILKCNALLSRRMQGFSTNGGFNGEDYISLSDYSKRDIVNNGKKNYNAYNGYIRCGVSLAFDKDQVSVIEPEIIDICTTNYRDYYLMKELGLEEERYSDLPDEVFVKDILPLDSLKYITFPVDEYFESRLYFSKKSKIKHLKEEIEELKQILRQYNYFTDIYDIDSKILLNEEGIENLVLKNNVDKHEIK